MDGETRARLEALELLAVTRMVALRSGAEIHFVAERLEAAIRERRVVPLLHAEWQVGDAGVWCFQRLLRIAAED